MKTITKLLILSAFAASCFSSTLVNAQSTVKVDAAKKHNTCVNSGAGVPTKLAFLACITAFDALIIEAQIKQHSAGQQRLYWAQAGQSAGLALLLQLKIDNAQTTENALTTNVCRLARSGLQAYSQVKPPAKKGEVDGLFSPPDYLTNIHNHCNAKKTP